jgi:hypothetical protein
MLNNIYEIFELPNFSTLDQIRSKYKELMKQNHPDKGGESETFNKIKQAYEYLKENKDEHDRKLKCKIFIKKDNIELYEKAEEIELIRSKNSYNYQCIQCFNMNDIIKDEPDDKTTQYITKCNSCSMIYKYYFLK